MAQIRFRTPAKVETRSLLEQWLVALHRQRHAVLLLFRHEGKEGCLVMLVLRDRAVGTSGLDRAFDLHATSPLEHKGAFQVRVFDNRPLRPQVHKVVRTPRQLKDLCRLNSEPPVTSGIILMSPSVIV